MKHPIKGFCITLGVWKIPYTWPWGSLFKTATISPEVVGRHHGIESFGGSPTGKSSMERSDFLSLSASGLPG